MLIQVLQFLLLNKNLVQNQKISIKELKSKFK